MAEAPVPLLAVACVAVGDLHPVVDALSGRVDLDDRAVGLSAADAAAVEHALRLAEAGGLTPLVVAAGPERLEPVLRELAGLGADVLRVAWPGPGVEGDLEELAADEAALATCVAEAIRTRGEARLVVCGDRSAGRGTGAFPAFLAHELGAAQALGLVALAPVVAPDGAAGGIPTPFLRGERRLEGGRREVLEIDLPAVCSVEAAGTRLRRGGLGDALAAAGRPVPAFVPTTPARPLVRVLGARPYVPRPRVVPAPTGTARERLLGLTGALSEREPPTVVGPIGAEEAAGLLLSYLDRNGFSLPGAAPGGGQG